ncbi:hypothetical protein PanWU01x14_083690 [Parasponia andersonii]|uniref:Uncharacterized protein n=1 Tax=Parasponia andersonii TaxID=3476 RepID=A0A2P5D9E1_PARAD|nr:hypothetical protein PanWU01x14_083690 [Parasponia andersonii]
MSLVNDLRKRTKRKLLCNQKLASKPQKRSYYGSHVTRRQPEKTYEEETVVQPKTCQQTTKTFVLWESRRSLTTRENVRRGNCCATKNLPADLKNARTMGVISLVNNPRKCTKRKQLRN